MRTGRGTAYMKFRGRRVAAIGSSKKVPSVQTEVSFSRVGLSALILAPNGIKDILLPLLRRTGNRVERLCVFVCECREGKGNDPINSI